MHIKLCLGLLHPEEAETYQKSCSTRCPAPDRHNQRGRPDVILYIHTSYCHLFNTSASSPSSAEWSPAKSPVMLQHHLSLLLGFTTSHNLVCCSIGPFPSSLPLFTGEGMCFLRVWGAGQRSQSSADMGLTSTKAALSPWELLSPNENIPTCCLHRIFILQSFPS